MALGISVASAEVNLAIPSTPADTESQWGFIWNGVSSSPAGGSNTEVYQPSISGNAITTLTFKFNDTAPSGNGNNTEYTASTNDTAITITDGGSNGANGKALQMGDGSGTLKINFNGGSGADIFTLDLSNTNANSKYSFVGNLETSYGDTKTYNRNRRFVGIFAKSVKGSITLNSGGKATGEDSLPNALTFKNGANLEGSLSVGYEDTGVLFEGNGGITGNLSKTDSGVLNITFSGSGSVGGTITTLGGTTNLNFGTGNKTLALGNLQGGKLNLIYKDTIASTDRVFNINSLSSNSSSSPLISGGNLVFDGVSKVFLNANATSDGSGTLYIAPKTIDTTTYQNGSVKFLLQNVVANNPSKAVVKGNINATNGSVIFALKDTSGVNGSNPFTDPNAVAPTDTYYVDGNITISNGGLSAFWDDSKGFYGKITQVSGTPNITGALIGKNDVWFATSPTGVTTIQSRGGTSHLVFDQALTISGNTTQQTIEGKARTLAIYSVGSNKNMILFKKDADITGDILAYNRGQNTLIFEGDTTIDGDLVIVREGASNTITASGNLTVNKILGDREAEDGWPDSSFNTINFNGNILTVKEGIALQGNYGTTLKNEIILSQANATLLVQSGGITARNGSLPGQNGYHQRNIITFENGGTLTLQGTNKDSSNATFNFDGLFSRDGDYNTITFESTTNDAIINVGNGQIVATSGGVNTIEGVKSFGTSPASIIAYGDGTNTITASHNLTIGSLQIGQGGEFSTDSAKNTVNFSGDTLTINSGIATAGYFGSSAVNEINLKNANASLIVSDKGITARQMNGFATLGFTQRNNITFEKGGELTLNGRGTTSDDTGFDFGGILARNGEQNTITFNSNNNAIINVTNSQILARDSGSNTITFNGSGTNTINSGITANGGTNTINFNNGGVGSISGDVIAQGGGTNTITAGNNLEIGSLQIGQGGTNSLDYAKNTVNFSGDTLTINSGIATAGYFGSSAVNEINLKNANASLIVSDKGITTRQINELADRNYTQRNNITFEKGGELTLNGSGTTSDDAGFDFGGILARDGEQNTITFNSNNNAIINVTNSQILASNGGINNITFNGTGTNTINSGITANGGTNTINFNNGGAGSVSGNVIAQGGTNTITTTNNLVVSGLVSASGSGTNTITATGGTAIFAGVSTKDHNSFTSGNTINFGSGSITINTRSGDSDSDINGKALYAKNGSNNNTITARTILINGEVFANSQATNSLTASSSITVTGNIGGGATNNFTLTADNATLTLSGATNNISSFTAFQTATNGNTLVLDGSNNGVNTTIATLANGEKLSVNFSEGNSAKTLAITASNKDITSQIDLKSVVLSGTSESNTLDLSTATQATIANQVNVAGNQDLTIKIGENSNLILTGGLTTAGTSEINVVGVSDTATSILSGGNITASKLNITSASNSSTLTFNSAITDFATFATNSATNAITLGTTAQTVTLGTTQNTATPSNPVVFGSVTFSGTNNQTLAINGGTNTIDTLILGSNVNTLAIGGGKTTIDNSVTLGAGKDFTLKLSSNSDKANLSSTDVVVNHALVANGGSAKVLFTGGTDNQRYLSTLTLNSTGNSLTSVTSQAKNAKILMNGASDANLGTLSIAQNASLLIGFEGAGTSSVTLGNGSSNVVIGDKQTFGISIGGSGTKNVSVTANGGRDIVFAKGSTLIVDFQKTTSSDNITATLGDGTGFRIEGGSNSIINLRGGEGQSTLTGGVTVAGGNNTVNFLDDATFGNVTLSSGSNTINVYDGTVGDSVVGTVTINDIDSVTNTINLYDYATLSLESGGTGTLTSSTLGNTLNFKGNGGKLQGGFGANGSGSATINVGSADKELVNGIITGNVSYADLSFNATNSTLTLKGASNTFTSLTSGATNGILYLDASGNTNVSATIEKSFTVGNGTSLTFALNSTDTADHNATVTLKKGVTVGSGGTLGIAIAGDGTGTRSVTLENGAKIDFQSGSTLRVDFLAGSQGTATLGGGATNFEIGEGRNSEINFYAGSGATLAGEGIKLVGGTNTANFYGNATLGQIELERGTNTINVKGASAEGSRITATLISNSLGGNKVSNTVNLEKFAVLNLKADKELATENGSGSIKTLVNVNDESTVIQGNLLDGSSIAFTKKAGGLTLTGARNSGATNALTTISTVDGATNTLTLDTTGGDNATTVSGALNASGLSINLAGTDATHKATLALNGGSLGAINVTNSANTLALNGRETSIDTFALASNAVLNIEFNGGGLNAVGGITKDDTNHKTFNLSANRGNSFVGGGNIDANTLSFANNASLAIRSAEASFGEISGSGTLTLDGAGAGANVEVTATRVDGNNITANFNGNATGGNTLVLSDTTTLADITFGANSTNNTLSVASGKTLTVANTEGVAIGSGNAITFSLANDSTLALTNGMTSAGTSTISVASNGSANRATLSGGNINVSNVSLSGNNASTLTLTATSTDIATLTTSATTSNTLIVDGTGSTNGASATLHTINGVLDVEMKGEATKVATLNLNGGTINSISAKAGNASENIINFKSGTTIITNAINSSKVASGQGLALNINGGRLILENVISTDGGGTINVNNNATLQLKGETNKINSLSGNGVVDLAMADSNGNPLTRSVKARSGFKTLAIANYKDGNNTFNLYVNTKEADKADKIVMNNKPTGNATFTVMGNIDDILGITYSETDPNKTNVLIASGTTGVNVEGGRSLIGYDIIKAQVIQTADGSVYLGQAISEGVAPEIKNVASSALTVNYDLFLANFNSLNKRMGELRDNPYAQGVWTRVFGGAMSSDFGSGSKTEYVTAQAGYDYSLTLGDARNYMGIAVAYGHSTTKSNALNIQASQGATIALQDVKSNMVEVGIYNSYVMDSGWYNDTIFKFDYIMSSFTMTDNLSLESETNNFAMVLSDEFGYRYKFAENEKGNWYIDPQVKVAFGYFNQSDFNRAMVATNSTLEASQDNILTLRTRAGLSLGKKFITEKGFASLYVGAFYEYDYINGGDAEVLSKSGIANPLDKLESNGRAIVNIGSNIELTEGVRMYIDVEKSFGDKQRTDMQFNFGARYSFGEKTPTISYQEVQKKRVAPLKVEDKQEAQESKTEAQANTEVRQ